MKKYVTLFTLAACAALLSGCATSYPVGSLYTGVQLPVDATSNTGGTKMGQSEATSILSLIATGDASIEAAKTNGGINEITHVDWDAQNFLGLFGKYTTTVYGN